MKPAARLAALLAIAVAALPALGEADLAELLREGQTWVQAGQTERGRPLLEQAVRSHPDSAAAHAALGHALMVERRFDEAVTTLERARELGESSPVVLLYLGASLWESGRIERSETIYRQALEASSRSPAAAQALGGLLLWQGRAEEALPLLEQAVAANASPAVRMDHARALELCGRADDAVAAYRTVLEQAPAYHLAHYRLAMLHRARGQLDAARAELELFQAGHLAQQQETRDARRSASLLDRGWSMLREGDAAGSARYFRALGRDVDALVGLAAALATTGDHGGSVDALEAALALDPERSELRLRLAEQRLAAGEGS